MFSIGITGSGRCSTSVLLDSGRILVGLVTEEEGKLLTLVDGEGKSHPLLTDEIEERRVTRHSPMPANVAEILPDKDCHDLIAFLLSQREATP